MRRRCLHLVLLLALATTAALFAGCFPRDAGPSLQHFDDLAPAVGESAPSFALETLDGERVYLDDLLGDGPVVLQFGSHSCPVYRYRRHWMDGLWEEYGERVRFVMVYTIEAHPVGSKSPYAEDEWDPWINRMVGVRVEQPPTYAARRERAATSKHALGIPITYLVDAMDDGVWQAYGAASSPAFVLDRNGTVVESQVWIDPDAIRAALDRLLANDCGPREGSPPGS
ncbi:MAG: deiodinase-like protein [Acidobacteriota bacterium]